MPQHDDWAEGLGWSETEEHLFSEMAETNSGLLDADPDFLQAFDTGWFDREASPEDRADARDFVIEWMDEVYGLDFDEVFDWAAWREDYEGGG